MIESFFNVLDKYLDKDYNDEKEEITAYLNHLDSIWGKGFAWLLTYYSKCRDICSSNLRLVSEMQITSDRCNVAEAILQIHGRAMLVFAEIICLLRNGYPDGAYMHYRTLHELWAVAELLNSDSDEVSIAFLESANKKSNHETGHYDWAKKSKHFQDIGKCKDVTIGSITNIAHELIIESSKDVSKNHLKKLYSFPSVLIHPSAKGVLFRTSEPYGCSITVGRVDTGIATPAINSSMIFFNITKLYLQFVPNIVSCIGLGILNKIVGEKIVPIFTDIQEHKLKLKNNA